LQSDELRAYHWRRVSGISLSKLRLKRVRFGIIQPGEALIPLKNDGGGDFIADVLRG
jgi:hypothetical protein